MDLVIFADLCPTSHHSMGHNPGAVLGDAPQDIDRKSTRLNSSHVRISYAVFCLKKKNRDLRGYHFAAALIGDYLEVRRSRFLENLSVDGRAVHATRENRGNPGRGVLRTRTEFSQ